MLGSRRWWARGGGEGTGEEVASKLKEKKKILGTLLHISAFINYKASLTTGNPEYNEGEKLRELRKMRKDGRE